MSKKEEQFILEFSSDDFSVLDKNGDNTYYRLVYKNIDDILDSKFYKIKVFRIRSKITGSYKTFKLEKTRIMDDEIHEKRTFSNFNSRGKVIIVTNI